MMSRALTLLLIACCFCVKSAWSYSFTISTLQGVTLSGATSLQFGPDQRLYVAQVNGQIKVLTVERVAANNYQVTATETIDLVHDIPNYNDDGTRNTTLLKRQVTGLLVVGTATNPVVYVTSSDPRIGGGSGGENDLNLDTNSGILSRLTKSGTAWTKVDLVRGLPRSEENHASNGMQWDPITNTLYLAQGGNTNAGSPSINFAYASETALAAAILSIDLNALNAMSVKTDAYGQKYLYNLPTLNDPNPARGKNSDGSNVNDPFGGNDGLNQAKLVAGGPVQIYAPGFRNAYDLVITRTAGREGRMYAFDNGANQGWGGLPKNEGPGGTVTNEYQEGEPGTTNNRDGLHYIRDRGYYGGHPNPVRANPSGAGWFHFDRTQPAGAQKIFSTKPTTDWPSVPVSMANPVEGDFRMPGTESGALITNTTSTNGIVEYTADNFTGAMKGNLIAASYDGRLLRFALSADGTQVTNGLEVLASGFGNLALDVTAPSVGNGDAFLGTIWVAHYSPSKISVLEPSDFVPGGGGTCSGIDSFDVDEDGDGYSNADEIANDSDPCSPAIRPPDADGDHTSDLFDEDDDNDGINDTQDFFAVDPQNGASSTIPAHYEFFNDNGTGFYGVGVTGLWLKNGEDYQQRITPDNVIAGGTAGLFTIAQTGAGTALGTSNSQMDAYQLAIDSSEFTSPFVATARLGGPFFRNAPSGSQRQGIYLGTGDQDNYVWLALHANNGAGGLEVVYELAGSVVSQNLYPFSGLSNSTVDLSFRVDPAAATLQPGYKLPGASSVVAVGSPIQVSGAMLQALMGAQRLAMGLFATNSSTSTPAFSATFDFFDIAPESSTAMAKVTVDPNSTNMATSSTYLTGAFKVQNLSTGGQQIDSVTIDLSTAMFMDMVYDSTGTAGDNVAKGFHADSATNGVSLASGTLTHPHNGANSQDGFDVADMAFNSFPANGTFTFSADVDPTSVKGVAQPGQGDSASVSGLELMGSTVSVYFSDGSVQRTRLSRVANSIDGAYGWLRADAPPKPGISFPGKSAQLKSGQSTQTVRVTGPAGLTASVVTVESALYLGGVPNGGYDVDAYESNTAIKVTEATGTIPSAGYKDFVVTPTKSNSDAGYNIITAVLGNSAGIKGPLSDALTLWYDPNFPGGGTGDTQAPSAPGALKFTNITSSSVTVGWTAATDNTGVTGYRVSRNGAVLTTVTGLSYTDTGLSPSTAYSYSVVAIDAAGNPSTASTASATTAAGSGGGTSTTVRINAGGPAYTDGAGNVWSADTGYTGGTAYSSTATVTGTTNPAVYKTERYTSSTTTPLTYTVTVPDGGYVVRLHFAETYAPNQAVGKRVFDVDVQGVRAFEDVDIFAQAGAGNKALVLEKPVSVTTGQLKVALAHQVENPKINAIEIVPATSSGGDTQAPSQPGALTFTNVTSTAATVHWSAATDNTGVTGYRISRGGTVLTTTTSLSYADSGLSPSTSYTYSVVALDAAGNVSTARAGSTTTTAASGGGTSTSIRVNAGGPTYTDGAGNMWAADTGYSGGVVATSTVTVTGTTGPTLHKTERYTTSTTTPLTYTFTVPNGSYKVRLFFAETYAPTQAAGKRVFDIDLQGARAFEDVDIFTRAGGANKALMLEHAASVTTGQIKIALLHQVENPKINAIEIVPDSGTTVDTQAPSTPGALTFSAVTTSSVTVNWIASSDNVGVSGYRVSRGSTVLGTVSALSYSDSGLAAGTSYTYSVVALDAAGNVSGAANGTISTTTSGGGSSGATVRVNTGGPAYTDGAGNAWAVDTGYSGGVVATSTATVTGTTDPTLYKTERYTTSTTTPLTYTFTVPNGSYNVRLFFAETYAANQAAVKRVFDIDLQGVRAFEDVDIFARAGGANKALVLEHTASVTAGQIKVAFLHQVENPKINAIEIVPSAAPSDTQAPSAPGALTFSSVGSSSVTINWSAATDNVGVSGYRVSRGSTVLGTVTALKYTDSGLTPGTSYTYSVVALDAAGNASAPRSATIATTSSGSTPTAIRINAGGGSYTGSGGTVWSADTGYNSGVVTTSTATVTGTTDPTLFKTERYSTSTATPLTYTFTVPNGEYTVRLHFAETWPANQAAGMRIFDVDVQGVRAFEDVDIFTQAGGANKALVLEKTAAVTSGQIKVTFTRQVENPKINAIEIIPVP